MGAKSRKQASEQMDLARQNVRAGIKLVGKHPIFAPLLEYASVIVDEHPHSPVGGLAVVYQSGSIYCRPRHRAEPDEWAHAVAHCLLHLGMGHFTQQTNPAAWNIACDLAIEKFLDDLKFGRRVEGMPLPEGIRDERKLYEWLTREGIRQEYLGFGTAGAQNDMVFSDSRQRSYHRQPNSSWPALLAFGLNMAVKSAVSVAAGNQSSLFADKNTVLKTAAQMERDWFVSSYPLLGAIAAGFKIIEDPVICQRMEIRVAAISPFLSEIYLNPAAGLARAELRFVMAHEFLHAALRHDARHEWREPYLWNVACDYVINGWLSEMAVGERPDGLLYDEQFRGMNAETVYGRIVTDMRRFRKLATLRGVALGDILPGEGNWWERGDGMDLDGFYRRALGQGLSYHQEQGRGLLPEGLVEEIRALFYPPIPWDVGLARWFDEQFTPLERIRSYARLSRRQSSAPDIPRPSWVAAQAALDRRTFGVILDTSGSMPRHLLAEALGAIASYSAARDVPAARVVFCDAAAYDQGYMKPEDIAGTVKVKGRGGTVLQPGIDLLLGAEDFPGDAPVLIITDGGCDRVVLHGREHAFLIPSGARLPFVPKGPVFRIAD